MITKGSLLSELDRRATLNENEGKHLDDECKFEDARYYFGAAGALRELAQDLADGLFG